MKTLKQHILEKLKISKSSVDFVKENKEDDKPNEYVSSSKQYPSVNVLGDGEYDGMLWGHCFDYNGHKYYSKIGWKNIRPNHCKMIIQGDVAFPKQIDVYPQNVI